MPLLLELFSGTGSVGKVAKEFGYDVISLDKDMEATLRMDIMSWEYKLAPPKTFDVISIFVFSMPYFILNVIYVFMIYKIFFFSY
jgi:hypothetical protein